jgi:transposase
LHHSAVLTVEHAAAGFHHNNAGLSNSLECAPTLSFQYAIITTALLTNSIVAMLPWPSKSPDLKPIEHLWDDLDRRVRQRKPQPESLQQLMNALQDEWNNIPQQVIRTLITPMGRAVRLLLIHVVDIRDIEL